MKANLSSSRQAGDRVIADHTKSQVQTFFDEIKNGTRNYQTVASLNAQVAQEYRGRCVLELLQNAHDALAEPTPDDARRISFVLSTSPEPVLLIGNTGRPFHHDDFKGICQLAQSPKDPNKSVGNKGLGFRSVLEVSGRPEIWSTTPPDSDMCFSFRFDPAVIDRIKAAGQDLALHGLVVPSPFDPNSPLVDWSPEQLRQFRASVAERKIDVDQEANSLSPYQLPLQVQAIPPDVQRLLDGHATVIRLPLDGGSMLASEDAVQSVRKQLDDLGDAKSVVFLDNLAELVMEVDGDRQSIRRTVCSDRGVVGHPRISQRRLQVHSKGASPESEALRHFRMWSRVVGGNDDPHGAEHIRSAVSHLPNRWPEVRQALVGVAVEDTLEQVAGVFVIFLPTERVTGTGAHINAPFYGSLDRRQINFEEKYNVLILDAVLDLCLDTVGELKGSDKSWTAKAIVDIVASIGSVGGERWHLMCKLLTRAEGRCSQLGNQAVILCDNGWRTPQEARVMPTVLEGNEIGIGWRQSAAFSVVSEVLDGRMEAVERLLRAFHPSSSPTDQEWINTVERVARQIGREELSVTWDDFLRSLRKVLPDRLLSKPVPDIPDLLAGARLLPTSDGRLIAASSSTKLFFRPIQGIDDLDEPVQDVPQALQGRLAFLHPDVQTHEGPTRSNTEVQKFLDGRFVKTYRTEDILREVVIPALPSLPVVHQSTEAVQCAAILAWTMKLVHGQPREALLSMLRELPVCCHRGWLPIPQATFGPDWPGRHGDDMSTLVDELPAAAARGLAAVMLLPPSDERWLFNVDAQSEFFDRAGVLEGLWPRSPQPVDLAFQMSAYSNNLLEKLPSNTPSEAWATWYGAVSAQVQPYYVGLYEYDLSGLLLLPEIHHLSSLTRRGRLAFSNLLLRSIYRWSTSWGSVTIRKRSGQSWQTHATSPLKHWLQSMSWLVDELDKDAQPLSQRWLIPESLPRVPAERYAHLDPLSLDLTKRLAVETTLRDRLAMLGLNVYPTEDDRTGPELLNALAQAWVDGPVPPGRFDVFLGQVREAWHRLDPDAGLPNTFLIRTGRRSLSAHQGNELNHVFLPNNRERSRALQGHGKSVLEMDDRDARHLAPVLVKATGINLSSQLEEYSVVNGDRWNPQTAATVPLDSTKYAWLPVVLLAVAAYGGTNPAGSITRQPWREAADRLRRARVIECNEIVTRIIHNDDIVAESRPLSEWLPGDVLAVRRNLDSHGDLALAGQAALNRQDLAKDLRLVLGSLPHEDVTSDDIEVALGKAEIDAQALADIQQQLMGDMSIVVDRLRPVLRLLEISEHGFEAAAKDPDLLTEWLSANLHGWDASELLSAARRSDDDYAMGMAARDALGEVAQLPSWNAALVELGDKYQAVENRSASEQTADHLDQAASQLRAFARHVALAAGDPSLFQSIEELARDFQVDVSWSRRWWEVPFASVLDSLIARYKRISAVAPFLEVIEGSDTADGLRDKLEKGGISMMPDPYETAATNRRRLQQLLSDVRDIYREWLKLDASRSAKGFADLQPQSDGSEYLSDWSDAKLLEVALQAPFDQSFKDACSGCSTLDAIQDKLDLTPQSIEKRYKERLDQRREAERRRRTYDVAGHPFEVGAMDYRDLFERLGALATPEGPRASKDEFTTLLKVKERKGQSAGGGPGGSTARPVRPAPADLTELVGVVGEIRALHYLRSEFGEAVVKHECWVSENRGRVLPPAKGDPHDISDSHGFDFRFKDRRRRTWYVEVKATAGDDSAFDLGISEIRAATQYARARGGRWWILRVRNALSEQPEVDLLPNPFEDEFKSRFRLREGGMRVSYRIGGS